MEAVSQPLGRVRVLEAFRSRDFRLLWSGQTVSLIGDAAFLTVLGWRTFTLAGAGKLGIVLLCQSVALLATLLIGGALADRLSRRRMMIVSDLVRFGAIAALAAVDVSGHLSFGVIVALATVVGLGDGLFYPAFGGIVPLVVERPSIASANSLIGAARWGSLVLGPALAGFLYEPAGSAAVFALDAGSFLLSAGLVFATRPRQIEKSVSEGTLREIVTGARYVTRVPWLWVTISLFALVLMLQVAPQQVLMPKLVSEQFDRGVQSYALLTTLFGAGMLAGTLAFGQLQPSQRRGVVSYVAWTINSLATMGIGLAPWYGLAGGLSVLRGLCVGFGVAVWETMLMELVPEHLLSRVVSLDYFGSFGLMPVGLALSAGVASLAAPGTLLAIGAGMSAALIALVLTRPWLWRID